MPDAPVPAPLPALGPSTLLGRLRAALRARHYSPRTEQAYVAWVRRYVQFHGRRHPATMGATEVQAFLTHLAERGQVSASTQNQAAAALLFLYEAVLGRRLAVAPDGVVHAKEGHRLPVVLTRDEVRAVLRELRGVSQLVALLLYGSGLRLLECLRLRVKDVDFGRGEIRVRWWKGAVARRLRAQGGWRGRRVGVAVGVSCGAELCPCWKRRVAAPSRPRLGGAAGGEGGRASGRHREAGDLSHPAPLVRHASPGGGLRHPDRAGATRSSRRTDHDDLYPRPEPRRLGGAESGGHALVGPAPSHGPSHSAS